MKFKLICIAILLGILSSIQASDFRQWKFKDGSTLYAEWVSTSDKFFTVQKPGGERLTYSESHLSSECSVYLMARTWTVRRYLEFQVIEVVGKHGIVASVLSEAIMGDVSPYNIFVWGNYAKTDIKTGEIYEQELFRTSGLEDSPYGDLDGFSSSAHGAAMITEKKYVKKKKERELKNLKEEKESQEAKKLEELRIAQSIVAISVLLALLYGIRRYCAKMKWVPVLANSTSTFAILIYLTCGFLLLIAASQTFPLQFYNILRWVISIGASLAFLRLMVLSGSLFFATAILVAMIIFNPLFPVEMERMKWIFVDVAAASLMFVLVGSEVLQIKKKASA